MSKVHYRILVVDDSRAMRFAVKSMLQAIDRCSFKIFEAEHGQEALELLTRETVDLIMTDLEMPQMDGFAFIKAVRQQERYKDLPILFLTAHVADEEKIKAFELGATDYVIKPFLAPELKARIMGYLERQRAHQIIASQYHLISEELEQARDAQKILFPEVYHKTLLTQLQVACKYHPMSQVGGDIYDVQALDHEHLGLMIADVTGHGVPAALLSFLVWGTFRNYVANTRDPHAVMNATNQILHGKLPNGKYATMFYGIYHAPQRTFTYVAAGHPPAMLIRQATGEILPLQMRGVFIGVFPPELARYQSRQVTLEPGDRLLLYTDGITEVRDAEEKIWGQERLQEFLGQHLHTPLEIMLEALYQQTLAYSQQGKFDDDVTLLALEVKA